MRHTVSVTCASSQPNVPPHKTTGIAPSITSPLAVTRVLWWVGGKWVEQDTWCITHRPTGFSLGEKEWDTSSAAYRVLLDCDPEFAGWRHAKGLAGRSAPDPTTLTCRDKFMKAAGIAGSLARVVIRKRANGGGPPETARV